MEIVIHGRNLPGRDFRYAAVPIHNVHVGVQVRDVPEGLVRADAPSAEWHVDVKVMSKDGALDFAGPAVHGKRGARFVYLTWGEVDIEGGFTMFRRAKLVLDAIEPALVEAARGGGRPLHADIDLTDDHGCPRCARVGAPALTWRC